MDRLNALAEKQIKLFIEQLGQSQRSLQGVEESKAIFSEFPLLDEAQSNTMQKYLGSQIAKLEKKVVVINTFEEGKTVKTLEEMLQKKFEGVVVMKRRDKFLVFKSLVEVQDFVKMFK